mgnify:CR=1 FL=1
MGAFESTFVAATVAIAPATGTVNEGGVATLSLTRSGGRGGGLGGPGEGGSGDAASDVKEGVYSGLVIPAKAKTTMLIALWGSMTHPEDAVRIDVAAFKMSKRWKRVLARNAMLEREPVNARATREQFRLLKKYLNDRHPGGGMTEAEFRVHELVERSLAHVAPAARTELLIEGPAAHSTLECVALHNEAPGCDVEEAFDCPAIRTAQTLHFSSADHLDACPHLRERGPCVARCQPVLVGGSPIGVLHTLLTPDNELDVRSEAMLDHLVDNAIKFTSDGGRVTITVSEAGTAARMTVEDTGIGIPDDKLGEIFQSFFQVDGSATRAHNGQGVGLAICPDIVQHLSLIPN